VKRLVSSLHIACLLAVQFQSLSHQSCAPSELANLRPQYFDMGSKLCTIRSCKPEAPIFQYGFRPSDCLRVQAQSAGTVSRHSQQAQLAGSVSRISQQAQSAGTVSRRYSSKQPEEAYLHQALQAHPQVCTCAQQQGKPTLRGKS